MKTYKYLLYSIILIITCVAVYAENAINKSTEMEDQMLVLKVDQKMTEDGVDINIYLLNKSIQSINVVEEGYGGESPVKISATKSDGKTVDIIVMQHRTYAQGYKPSPPKIVELFSGDKIVLGALQIKKIKFLTGSYGLHGRIIPGVLGFTIKNCKDKSLFVSISYNEWVDELNKLNPHIEHHDFKNDVLVTNSIKLNNLSKSKKNEEEK